MLTRSFEWVCLIPRRRGGYKDTRLTRIAVAADEDKEALAGCNDVTRLKAWVVHGVSVGGFGVLLAGVLRWMRIGRAGTGIRDEFLGPTARILHTLLPLLGRKRGVREVLGLLCQTVR